MLICLSSGWLDPAVPALAIEKKPSSEIKIVVDPRVELLSIIFRLARNNEYNQRGVIPYVENIQKYFDRFKSHPAVAMAKDLRKNFHIGFDAPMRLAIYLTDSVELKERVPFDTPGVLDSRWNAETVRGFSAEIRRFVKDADFMGFFKDNQKLYDIAVERAKEFIRSEVHLEWFNSYFRTEHDGEFILVLAPNNGGPSYGPFFRSREGSMEYYCILGLGAPLLDEHQLPTFGEMNLNTIVHEFCHSFVNPLVDRHLPELKALGERIFPLVKTEMSRQAYGDWETMMKETFVRASVLRYIYAYKGEVAAKKDLEEQLARRFILVEKIYDSLAAYEQHQKQYASLEAFFPHLISALNDFADKPEEFDKIKAKLEELNARAREEQRKRLEELRAHPERLPKVAKTIPADGEMNVDPDLRQIRIIFDRPMRQNTLFTRVANTKFPEFTEEYGWESQSTIHWSGVKLEPGTEYAFGLNSEQALGFADEKGNPLLPVVIRFKTRSRAPEPELE